MVHKHKRFVMSGPRFLRLRFDSELKNTILSQNLWVRHGHRARVLKYKIKKEQIYKFRNNFKFFYFTHKYHNPINNKFREYSAFFLKLRAFIIVLKKNFKNRAKTEPFSVIKKSLLWWKSQKKARIVSEASDLFLRGFFMDSQISTQKIRIMQFLLKTLHLKTNRRARQILIPPPPSPSHVSHRQIWSWFWNLVCFVQNKRHIRISKKEVKRKYSNLLAFFLLWKKGK